MRRAVDVGSNEIRLHLAVGRAGEEAKNSQPGFVGKSEEGFF